MVAPFALRPVDAWLGNLPTLKAPMLFLIISIRTTSWKNGIWIIWHSFCGAEHLIDEAISD
jgi:hypothetical protein